MAELVDPLEIELPGGVERICSDADVLDRIEPRSLPRVPPRDLERQPLRDPGFDLSKGLRSGDIPLNLGLSPFSFSAIAGPSAARVLSRS